MLRRLAIIGATVLITAFTGAGAAPAGPATPQIPTLVDIRAAHHPTFDRLVFEFDGPLPAEREVRHVSTVTEDGSGFAVPMVGDALLQARFSTAYGHDDAGRSTFGPRRRTFPLPNLIQVNAAGDYEAVLTFGISLARATSFEMFTLTSPSRVVIDIEASFATVGVQVYFIDDTAMQTPRAVQRPVIGPATSRGALQRLFAGPTQQEIAAGLRLVTSGAGGFAGVSITDGVARVQLTDDCGSLGSTITIAGEIMPTLKQFPTVRWVKILDPLGDTEEPIGASDSIPYCLEP